MITSIIRNSNDGITCTEVHGKQLTDVFEVRTGEGKDEARILADALHVPPDNRLGHEDIHSPETKWHPVDTLDAVG